MKEELKSLIASWQLDEEYLKKGIYIAKADKHLIENKGIDENGIFKGSLNFNFSLKPMPWWGNINDPKVIVLVLNPVEKITTKDNKMIYHDKLEQDHLADDEIFENNLKSHESTINWLTGKKMTSQDWWTKTFHDIIDGLKNKGIENPKELIYKKIGIFELFGYYSKSLGSFDSFDQLLKKEFNSTEALGTQSALFYYLNGLLNVDKPPLVVVIWGHKYWKEKLNRFKIMDQKNYLDYIHTISTSSHYLSKSNLRDIDFIRIINEIIK